MARILIVDDSKIVRRNLNTILSKAGHEIIAEAENGMQAYHEYTKYKPDLVTMDITMPLLDGVRAVKKIITADPDAKIIMVSAIDQKNMVIAAIQMGAKHYILKPFDPVKVIAAVNAVLDTKSGGEQPPTNK
ncbi:MAG: response regulator [Syntrophomonadaceae bacterium]|jgi:two-component system chemotaxis response regulator CheY|nr:response regulator [Syntrophomonadaceae bacterium]